MEGPDKGIKEVKGSEEREIRPSLLILDLKEASCKIQESKKGYLESFSWCCV